MATPATSEDRSYALPLRVQPASSSPFNSVGSPFLSGLLKVSRSSPAYNDIQCPEDGYSLDDLTDNLSDSPEVVAKDWIKGLLDNQQKREFAFHTNETIPLFLQAKFHPLLVGVHSRPDVVCTRNGIPRLVIEVESKRNYKYTIQETILSMIVQFRILRCFDDSISCCTGFTFPTIDRKFGVTKVFLRYNHLVFEYSLKLLDKVDVIPEIKSVLREQLPQYNHAFYPYLIRLSRQELDLFGIGAIQVKTKSSLVVHSHDGTTYWKYSSNCTPHFDDIRGSNLRHSLLPKTGKVKIGRLYFFVYDGLCPPLPRVDARSRLSSLLPTLKEALDELHSNDIAHMDVRLENICFKGDGSVQLIDLDRCLPASTRERICGESDMYMVPNNWDNFQIDFRAVGMMLCHILSQPVIPEYHKMVRNGGVDQWKNNHQFIKSLLDDGVWDSCCYVNFNEYLSSIMHS